MKDSDGKLFERVFIIATDNRPIVVEEMLKNIDIDTLKEMNAALSVGNKSNHLPKIKSAVDCMRIIKDMITAKDKLSKSIEIAKTKIASAIWDHVCEQADDKQFDMTILKMNIACCIKGATKSEMQT